MSIHKEAIDLLEREISTRENDYKMTRSYYEKMAHDSFEKLTKMDNEIKNLKDTMIFLIESAI